MTSPAAAADPIDRPAHAAAAADAPPPPVRLLARAHRRRHRDRGHPPGADQGPRPRPDRSSTRPSASSRGGRRSSRSSSSRSPARSATTRSAGSAGASRTSSSGRCSTSCSSSASRPRTPSSRSAAFVVLLQFSANFAQGPFQGYVPDLVPPSQVGLASGLVGLFTVLGVVVGTGLASIGLATGDFTHPDDRARDHRAPDDAVAVLPTRRRTGGEGPRGPQLGGDRRGGLGHATSSRNAASCSSSRRASSSSAAARSCSASQVPYLERAQGIVDNDERAGLIFATTGIVALCTAISTIPAARIADRVGPQAGHLRGVPDRRRWAWPSAGSRRPSRSSSAAPILVGIGDGQLPGGRLGADDRHHPQGVGRPVHGHLERRDRDQRRDRRVHRRRADRRARARGRAGARAAVRVPAGARVVRHRGAAAAARRRGPARGRRPDRRRARGQSRPEPSAPRPSARRALSGGPCARRPAGEARRDRHARSGRRLAASSTRRSCRYSHGTNAHR